MTSMRLGELGAVTAAGGVLFEALTGESGVPSMTGDVMLISGAAFTSDGPFTLSWLVLWGGSPDRCILPFERLALVGRAAA